MIKRRMVRYAVRFFLCILALCLLSSCTLAESAPSFSPMFSDWYGRVKAGEAVKVNLTANLQTLVPYGDETVTAMDSLLSQCGLMIAYQQKDGLETTDTQLLIGSSSVLSFLEQAGSRYLAKTSLLPDMTLASEKASPVEQLLGGGYDLPFWVNILPDPAALSQEIAGALAGLSPFAQEKAGSFSLLNVGRAKKAIVYTIPQESAVLLGKSLASLASALHWEEASALFETLTLTGDASVTLYQSAEGTNMGLGIKATVGFGSASPRRVTFLWGFATVETQTKHTLSIRSPSVSGADNLTVAGQWTMKQEETKNSLSFSLDIKNKLNGKTDRAKWTGKLDCLMAQDNQRLEGEIKSVSTDQKGTDTTLLIKPSLLIYRLSGKDSLKGSARIQWSVEKAVQVDATFTVLAEKAEDAAFGDAGNVTNLDGLAEEEWKTLDDKAQVAAVKAVWHAVMALPESCLTLISKGISKADWEKIYQGTYLVEH